MLALAGVASAGLLSYYGKVVGTATVSQSVKLSDYDANGQIIQEIDYTGTITYSGSVVAGDTLVNGNDASTSIEYFKVKNYATESGANVKVGIDNDGDDQIDDTSLLDSAIDSVEFVEYSSGTCTNTEIGSEITGKVGRELTLNAGGEQDFCIQIKFKINAEPGSYVNNVKVLPG
ncbi:MAG: hypothetical protein QW676_02860 [Candidatus Aenigmatarchaeota archaeon]